MSFNQNTCPFTSILLAHGFGHGKIIEIDYKHHQIIFGVWYFEITRVEVNVTFDN